MIETVSENYVGQLRKKYPTISAEQLQSLQRQIAINLSATKDDYINHMVDLYAEFFSVAEMRAATTFYQSDAGKKMTALTPSLIPQLGAYQSDWTSSAVTKATNDINASLKAPQ